ncbi:hypothetical protein YQE_00339, partial [Dendroctonus ponderosae]
MRQSSGHRCSLPPVREVAAMLPAKLVASFQEMQNTSVTMHASIWINHDSEFSWESPLELAACRRAHFVIFLDGKPGQFSDIFGIGAVLRKWLGAPTQRTDA